MFTQFLLLNGLSIGSAVATITLQQPGVLYAVQFAAAALATLGAGDEFLNELELSINNQISATSNLSPPNGVICKTIFGAAVDIAGTSMCYSIPIQEYVPVAPRRFVAGQIIYAHIGALFARAGGVGTLSGYANLHFKP